MFSNPQYTALGKAGGCSVLTKSDCAHCGQVFEHEWKGQYKKYCSSRCKKASARHRALDRVGVDCVCARCGKAYKAAPWDIKAGSKYCSKDCSSWAAGQGQRKRWNEIRAGAFDISWAERERYTRAARIKAEIAALQAIASRLGRPPRVASEVDSIRRIAKRAGAVSGEVRRRRERFDRIRDMASRPCEHCGKPVGYLFGRGRRLCSNCSTSNPIASAMRYPMRDDRVLAAGRRHDDITRWEVFEHYGWHCNACGVETPAYMIGTDPLNPRAPVVDHVLPVARGGEHIWKNLQLLCRQCNTIKGDKLNSELLEILEGMGAIRSSPNPRRHSLGASFFTSTEFSMNNLHKGMNNGTARAAT